MRDSNDRVSRFVGFCGVSIGSCDLKNTIKLQVGEQLGGRSKVSVVEASCHAGSSAYMMSIHSRHLELELDAISTY